MERPQSFLSEREKELKVNSFEEKKIMEEEITMIPYQDPVERIEIEHPSNKAFNEIQKPKAEYFVPEKEIYSYKKKTKTTNNHPSLIQRDKVRSIYDSFQNPVRSNIDFDNFFKSNVNEADISRISLIPENQDSFFKFDDDNKNPFNFELEDNNRSVKVTEITLQQDNTSDSTTLSPKSKDIQPNFWVPKARDPVLSFNTDYTSSMRTVVKSPPKEIPSASIFNKHIIPPPTFYSRKFNK